MVLVFGHILINLTWFIQVSDVSTGYNVQQQPTLALLGSLLNSVTATLERACEEKSLLLNKVIFACFQHIVV